MTMNRIPIHTIRDQIGTSVTIAGWIHVRRDHGKLIFLDIRDETGVVQCVALPSEVAAHETAGAVRNEWVVEATGTVNTRPEKMVNNAEPNGDIELVITALTVLNEAQTPPFDIGTDTSDIDESVRLLYRYLDLRTARMQRNIRTRSDFVQAARNFLFRERFTEIETPLLTKSTPEGSRDFLIPSRLQPSKFYALPQSPQQYKQLLMASGFEKYFQIARAVRDEDLRADRGFEHTQIDLEMAFVEQEDVMRLVERMITDVVEGMGKTILKKPFPRIPYAEAMAKYGADKFDLRSESEKEEGVLAYAWVVDFPFFEKDEKTGRWTFTHNPFSMPIQNHLEKLLKGEAIEQILTTQYDLVCNGYESGGGSIRAHRPEILKATYAAMGYAEADIEASVGHMLDAFSRGVPPHGGIALGVERNVMNITGEKYLREVQAFPMTSGGKTAVMDAPSAVPNEQLRELGIQALPKAK